MLGTRGPARSALPTSLPPQATAIQAEAVPPPGAVASTAQVVAVQQAINAAAAAVGLPAGPTDGTFTSDTVALAAQTCKVALQNGFVDQSGVAARVASGNVTAGLMDQSGVAAVALFSAIASAFAVPWYKKWYVWAGVAAAGIVAGGGLWLARRKRRKV